MTTRRTAAQAGAQGGAGTGASLERLIDDSITLPTVTESPSNTLPTWARDVLLSMTPMVSRAQAATTLNITERQVDRLIAARVLTGIKQGTRTTVPRWSVVSYLLALSGEKVTR